MTELDSLIVAIEKSFEEMKRRETVLKSEKTTLEVELEALRNTIREKEERIAALEEDNKLLRMTRSIEGTNEGGSEMKLKINELVKEIDKCIALLNR